MFPVVSVIIPVYNVEPYLIECLDSVCKQSLKDIEIICVNDGSTDQSLAILEKYAVKDKRIRIINQKNHGLSYSRNRGLFLAEGKYIYFLDSDDYIAHDALEVLVSNMEDKELQILLFNAIVFGDKGVDDYRIQKEKEYFRRICEYPSKCKGEDLFRLLLKNKEYKSPVSIQIVKSEFLHEKNIKFQEGIIHEDELYTFQCLLLASRAGYLADSFYYRRVRPNSIMDLVQSEKLVRSVFSCFICAKQMLKFCHSMEFKEENEDFIFANIERMISICQWRYGFLNETDRNIILKMTGKDKFLFRSIIMLSINYKEYSQNLKAVVNTKQKRIEEQVKRISDQKSAMAEQVKQISDQKAWIEEQVKQISNQKAVMTELVKQISDQKAAMTEQVKQISDQKDTIEELIKQISNQKAAIEEQVKQISSLKAVVSEQINKISKRNAEINKNNSEKNQLKK